MTQIGRFKHSANTSKMIMSLSIGKISLEIPFNKALKESVSCLNKVWYLGPFIVLLIFDCIFFISLYMSRLLSINSYKSRNVIERDLCAEDSAHP